MKTRIKNLFLLPVLITYFCFIRAESARGQSGNYNGFEWEQIPTNAVEITGYTGPGGAVAIPGTIPVGTNNLPVTSVGNEAFEFTHPTSITIPDSVTSIGSQAFSECFFLTNVVIGSGLTSIGSGVFLKIPAV